VKITRIRVYKTPLPYVDGSYAWGAGNAIETAMASVVVIGTDAGLQGCGEFTPCGENYMVEKRIPVVSEDSWGGEIATAAVAHFAASTPSHYLQNTTDLKNYNTRSTGIGGATARNGRLYAPDTPGLGVVPDFDSLGAPVAEYAT
jgi:L-alanine-DL-glutamate epimerase-like enolase superfamily enzyme